MKPSPVKTWITGLSNVVVLFLFSCSNEFEYQMTNLCDAQITNLRTNVRDPLIGVDSLHSDTSNGKILKTIECFFDYHGECLDSNTYFVVELKQTSQVIKPEFINKEEVDFENTSIYRTISYGDLLVLDSKIRLNLSLELPPEYTFTYDLSILGNYGGYTTSENQPIRSTNSLQAEVML